MNKKTHTPDISLKDSLLRLREISDWFENQDSVDVEEGLQHVKEGVELVKRTREKLKTLENEFSEIKATIETEEHEDTSEA